MQFFTEIKNITFYIYSSSKYQSPTKYYISDLLLNINDDDDPFIKYLGYKGWYNVEDINNYFPPTYTLNKITEIFKGNPSFINDIKNEEKATDINLLLDSFDLYKRAFGKYINFQSQSTRLEYALDIIIKFYIEQTINVTKKVLKFMESELDKLEEPEE